MVRSSQSHKVILAVILAILAGVGLGAAQSGAAGPDPNFGTGGSVRPFVGNEGVSQLLAPGNDIIAVGTKFSVAKFDVDGIADQSFSFDPLDAAPQYLQVGYEEFAGARLDRWDNLVIAGQYSGNRGSMPWLTKVDTEGRLALPFADKGYWIPKKTMGFRTSVNEIAMDQAGRIYVAVVRAVKKRGSAASRTSIQRLTPNGRPDSNFADTSSKRVLKRGAKSGYASVDGLTVTSDGKIIYSISTANGAILRALKPDGSRDRAFGHDGKLHVNHSFSVAKLTSSGNRVLLWGNLARRSPRDTFAPYAVALRSNGRVISTFGRTGRSEIDVGLLASAGVKPTHVVTPATFSLDKKGRAIASFNVGTGRSSKARMTAIRLNQRGRLDRSFGEDGAFQAPVEYNSENSSVTLDDGSVVVDAAVADNGATHPGLYRLLP